MSGYYRERVESYDVIVHKVKDELYSLVVQRANVSTRLIRTKISQLSRANSLQNTCASQSRPALCYRERNFVIKTVHGCM